MAAAALSSRGVAGVRTTKGLFFIVALLSLVCVARTWIDKGKLEKYKDNLYVKQQRLNVRMAEMDTTSEYMLEFMSHLDRMIDLMKIISATPHTHPVNVCLKRMEATMVEAMKYTIEHVEKVDEARNDTEKELGEVEKLLTFIEETEAEL